MLLLITAKAHFIKIEARSGKIKDVVEAIRQIEWESVIFNGQDHQEAWDNYYNLIQAALDLWQPSRLVKTKLG